MISQITSKWPSDQPGNNHNAQFSEHLSMVEDEEFKQNDLEIEVFLKEFEERFSFSKLDKNANMPSNFQEDLQDDPHKHYAAFLSA